MIIGGYISFTTWLEQLDVDANLTVKSVKWFKDGSVMYDGEEMELLSVTMSDAGVYKVTVKTDMDSATTSVELIVQGSYIQSYFILCLLFLSDY